MIRSGKCPNSSCAKVLSNVKIEYLDIVKGMVPAFKGVSYVCPYCYSILGVGIDPVAIKTDIVESLKR